MPRPGWKKPDTDRRLSDLIAVGLLTRVFPPDVVDEVIAQAGRTQQRSRILPARVMVYYAIAMALTSDGSYEDVYVDLTDGLSWASGWPGQVPAPSRSAIFQARARLGSEPVEALFRRVARPMARLGWEGGWLAGKRLLAVDGTTLDVPDTDVNVEYFGRPGTGRGQAGYPQARVVAIAECGSHAVMDAVIGGLGTGETTLADELIDRLEPDAVLVADRRFYSFHRWARAQDTGAQLLWRIRKNVKPTHVRTLEDGTWLATITPSSGPGWCEVPPRTVRVVDYQVTADDPDGSEESDIDDNHRLLTTLLDPDGASAQELIAAYHSRWEIENTFDELKTHQRGQRMVLRSKSPELVRQEIWGHLCCHYAIRTLMADTATAPEHSPVRVSFVKALKIARRSVIQGSFPPLTTRTPPEACGAGRCPGCPGTSTHRGVGGRTRG